MSQLLYKRILIHLCDLTLILNKKKLLCDFLELLYSIELLHIIGHEYSTWKDPVNIFGLHDVGIVFSPRPNLDRVCNNKNLTF